MGLLTSSRVEFFGLDIGTDELRLVRLRGDYPMQMVNFAIKQIDPKISTSDADSDKELLAREIGALVAESGVSTKKVVLGMPSKSSYYAVIDAPNMSKQELAKSAPYLAEKYIPVSLDQVKISWSALGPSPIDPNKQEIFIAAAKNTTLEDSVALVESIGLEVVGIEPDTVALGRSSVDYRANDAQLIVDVGLTSTDLVVVYNQSPRLVRNVPIGSESIIKYVVNDLNVDKDQAIQFVEKFGFDGSKLEGQVSESLGKALQNLLTEVEKSTAFFTSRYKNVQISMVQLGGFAYKIPGIDGFVTEKINLKSQLFNPLVNVTYNQQQSEQLRGYISEIGVVVGLAGAKL